MGRGCNTAVEHTPPNQEVMGSTPVLGFFLFLSFSTLLHQVPQGGAALTLFVKAKTGCLAVLPGANHAHIGFKKLFLDGFSKLFSKQLAYLICL